MAEEKKDKAEYELDLASDCGWIRGLDAAGKPIRISKADMVELIRANMPVATSEKNGLMSSTNADHAFIIPFGGEVEIPGSSYCMLLIKNPSSGSTSILLIGHIGINILYTAGDVGTDINGNKIVVYKKGGGENCFIKNNAGDNYRIITFVL